MKVYVLDNSAIIGIFSSRERAEEVLEEYKKNSDGSLIYLTEWTIDEREYKLLKVTA